MSEFIYDPKPNDLSAINAVKGMERLARIVEQQDGPEYDVELRYANSDPRPLFTVREMACGTGTMFGVRHDESGCWYPHKIATRERAEAIRDGLSLNWCEGYEVILVENFQTLTNEEEQ